MKETSLLKKLLALGQKITSADRVQREFKQYTLMHALFILSTCTTCTFVNTLQRRVCTDANAPLIYDMLQFFFTAVGMICASFLMKRINNKQTVGIGIVLSMLVYPLVILLTNELDWWYPLIALVQGMGSGFYWIIYYDSVSLYSTDDTRDASIGFLSVFSGTSSVIMPLVSGFIIEWIPDLAGYYAAFGLCFVIGLLALFALRPLKAYPPRGDSPHFLRSFGKCYTNKAWFYTLHGFFWLGLREGAVGFFMSLLLFSLAGSEALVGINSFLSAIGSIFAAMLAGKIVHPRNRMKLMAISITILLGAVATLLLWTSPIMILIVSVLMNLIVVYMANPTATAFFRFLDAVPGANDIRSEVTAITECYKTVGRCAGILLIMFMPQTTHWGIIGLLILIAAQYITGFFAAHSFKESDRAEAAKGASLCD